MDAIAEQVVSKIEHVSLVDTRNIWRTLDQLHAEVLELCAPLALSPSIEDRLSAEARVEEAWRIFYGLVTLPSLLAGLEEQERERAQEELETRKKICEFAARHRTLHSSEIVRLQKRCVERLSLGGSILFMKEGDVPAEVNDKELLAETGVVRIPLTRENRSLLLRHASDGRLRQTIFQALSAGSRENVVDMQEIVALKHKAALEAGFDSHAHRLMSDGTLFRDPYAVMGELLAMRERSRADLVKYLAGDELWDLERRPQKIRNMRHAVRDLLELHEQHFKLRFKVLSTSAQGVQHLLVEHELYEQPRHLYLDLFARKGKAVGSARTDAVSLAPPTCVILAEFSDEGTDRDVALLWHEFGHALHYLSSRSSAHSHFFTRGFNLPADMLELPGIVHETLCEQWLGIKGFTPAGWMKRIDYAIFDLQTHLTGRMSERIRFTCSAATADPATYGFHLFTNYEVNTTPQYVLLFPLARRLISGHVDRYIGDFLRKIGTMDTLQLIAQFESSPSSS